MKTSHIVNFWQGMDVKISLEVARIVGIQIYNEAPSYRDPDGVFSRLRGPQVYSYTIEYNTDGEQEDWEEFNFNLFATLPDGITPTPDADAAAAVVRRALMDKEIYPATYWYEDRINVSLFDIKGFLIIDGHHHQNENHALALAVLKMGKN